MNPNKTISASATGVLICYADSQKHQWMYYDNKTNPNNKHYPAKGVSKYQQLEFKSFNKTQQQLYNQVVYGLSSYSESELAELSPAKKRKITDLFNKTQILLNLWKQEIINESVNSFLSKMFPNSRVVKDLAEMKDVDNKIKNKMSFKELKITRVMIATRLVEAKILPVNFFNLGVC